MVMVSMVFPVLGAGIMTLPKYRPSGSEVYEMAEYKYPDPNYTKLYSSVKKLVCIIWLIRIKTWQDLSLKQKLSLTKYTKI